MDLTPELPGSLSSSTTPAPAPALPTGCANCRDAKPAFPFSMAFQPVVDVERRAIDAYEALVRGPNGEGAGAVLAQLTPENRYAFDQACRVKAIELATALGFGGFGEARLNINFLPNAVYEPAACIRLTLEAARRTGFPLDRLTFEIVEQEELSKEPHLKRIIEEYKRHGFKVALDDFATGYSGLARLAALRPDIVKLDRMMVQDVHQDRVRLAIVAAVVALCREIDVKLVIEGVETAEEVAALRGVGGRYMQGFYFAKPAFEALPGLPALRWPAPSDLACAGAAA
ncbi:EAL domain-containing protein [Dongia sp.]|uniref:EAL domain-containing protein n=1 Tax=Dongia sp. TaxID=1977262 RepID=UPI003752A27E